MSRADPLKPSTALLCKLGSLIVHHEEFRDTEHPFDLKAIETLRSDPDVVEWFTQMQAMAMVPVNR